MTRQKPRGVETTQKAAGLSGPQLAKLNQTSMDMFTRKGTRPSTSQPVISRPPSVPQPAKASSQPIDLDGFSDFDPDSSELEALTSLISRSPTSPSKCAKDVFSSSPSPCPSPVRKKKLLVPRTSAVGFFNEVEVDADEYEDRVARETALLQRRGGRGRVTRMSDVVYVDLTLED